ncbi:50S ribosomal protein L19 [Candidatus Fermentibacteria bacterium]|nr:50S ribosomal protein L19 [Candidatus Fermentibacteria bacterium]
MTKVTVVLEQWRWNVDILQTVSRMQMRDPATVEEFNPGDTVKVHLKVVEGDKERAQIFQGVVLQRRGQGVDATFTVRKVSGGIGVERVFPLHSPVISKIEVSRRARVRRAKLFYLRDRKGKAARLKEKKS